MLSIRYEEHNAFKDKIPFELSCSIVRSRSVYSNESNWHDALEIQLCRAGRGVVLIDGERYDFFEHDIAVINHQAIHHTGTDTGIEYDCLIIDSKFCRDADVDPQELCFDCLIRDKVLQKYFLELENLYYSDDICRTAKLRVCVLRILICLREHYAVSEKKLPKQNSEHELTKKAIMYIRENFAAKISIDMIAANIMTNKCTLSRAFKRLTGQTIVEYINRYRCARAAECIMEGMMISDAAQLCGFNNMSFFTRTFKRNFGRLPSRMRSTN